MLLKFFGLQHTIHGSLSKFTQFWGSKVPNSKSLQDKFYKPLFRFILPKSAHFFKSFGCLAASKQGFTLKKIPCLIIHSFCVSCMILFSTKMD